jgi:hypothetical protein
MVIHHTVTNKKGCPQAALKNAMEQCA